MRRLKTGLISMHSNSQPFPIINRVIVSLASLMGMVSIPWVIAQHYQNNELDIATTVLLTIFFFIACFGLWLSLRWKPSSGTQIPDDQSFVRRTFEEPSESTLSYSYFNGFKESAIHLDVEAERIIFMNCHTPRKFLAMADHSFECSAKEIHAIYSFRYRGESLTVITKKGRVVIPIQGKESLEIKKQLIEWVPTNQKGHAVDHPMMSLAYILGALGGLFGGVVITPSSAAQSSLGLFVLAGAALGTAGVYLAVKIFDQWIGVNLAKHLGYAVIGGGFGLTASQFLVPILGWNLMVSTVLIALGGLTGFVVSLSQKTKAIRVNEFDA